MDNRDPFFGGPVFTSATDRVLKLGARPNSGLIGKITSLRGIVAGMKELLPQSASSPALINAALFQAITDPRGGAGKLGSLTKDFTDLVPVFSDSAFTRLTIADDTGLQVLQTLESKLESGEVSESYVAKFIQGIRSHAGLASPGRKGSIEEEISDVRTRLEKLEGIGAAFVERGSGSESKVYTGGDSGFVYKVSPVRQRLLDIPPVKAAQALYPRLESFPFAGVNGTTPWLDRLEHMALLPNMAPGDLVAVTPGGKAVFRQPDLGDAEPDMGVIASQANTATTATLAPQRDDPLGQFDNDTSLLPMVGVAGGKPVLMLDVNPRNSRMVDGQLAIFDAVTRELSCNEAAVHNEISEGLKAIGYSESPRRPRKQSRSICHEVG